jgi:glutathione S-transferase
MFRDRVAIDLKFRMLSTRLTQHLGQQTSLAEDIFTVLDIAYLFNTNRLSLAV